MFFYHDGRGWFPVIPGPSLKTMVKAIIVIAMATQVPKLLTIADASKVQSGEMTSAECIQKAVDRKSPFKDLCQSNGPDPIPSDVIASAQRHNLQAERMNQVFAKSKYSHVRARRRNYIWVEHNGEVFRPGLDKHFVSNKASSQ